MAISQRVKNKATDEAEVIERRRYLADPVSRDKVSSAQVMGCYLGEFVVSGGCGGG